MVNYKYLLCLVLGVINVILITVTCVYQDWMTQNDLSMSLTSCTDCEGNFEGWSWECFAHTYCDDTSSSGYCDLYEKGYNSSHYFLAFEILSLIMCLLLCEKLLTASLHRDFGHVTLFYIYAPVMLLSHITATALFFIFSEGKWSDCETTTDPTKTPDICLQEGPIIAIINIVVMILTTALVFYVNLKRKAPDECVLVGLEDGTVFAFSVRTCFTFEMLLILFAMGGILLGSSVNEWIWRDTIDDGQFVGSLIRCNDCHFKYDWFGYDCLAGEECHNDKNSDTCKTYTKLADASYYFVFIEICVLCLLIMHIQALTAFIGGRDYGLPSLNYMIISVAAILQVCAISFWFGITEIKFFANCESDEAFEFCARAGPSIVLAGSLVLILAAIIFVIAYCKRGKSINIQEYMIQNQSKSFDLFSSIDSPQKMNDKVFGY